jgi:hypothetical protein
LAINEAQLCLKQMQVDNDLFPVKAIDLQGAKMLVRPEQAESTKGKNVIIDEERPKSYEDKIWSSDVMLEKAVDGKNVLKIIVKAFGLEGQADNLKQDQSSVQPKTQSQPVRLVTWADQTSPTVVNRPKMLKPKNLRVDEWKVVKAKVKGKKKNFQLTFNYLLSKYVNQKTESRDRSSKGSVATYLKQDRSHSHRSDYVSNVIKIGSMDVSINDQVGNKILDHGASNKSLASKYMQPRWCHPNLSHTQKRRLQQH